MVPSASPHPVLTGCGAVSPFGAGVDAFWDGLLSGRSALAPVRGFETADLAPALACEVPPGSVTAWLDGAEIARLERIEQYALAAAREALADAGLDLARLDRASVAVVMGTTLGAMSIGEDYLRARCDGSAFAARRLLRMPYAATATRLARALGVRGPVMSPSVACASGTHAVGLARELIQLGHAEVVIAGGAEALCHFVVAGFNALKATTSTAVRPFDVRRDGLALGEGAAVVVVESAAHAARRGAAAPVEVAGCGLSGDAVHMTAPARDGAGAARAIRAALADAGMTASDIDLISAHGTGTVYNDAMEMVAVRAVCGAATPRVPVSGIKGAIGHTLAAAGAFEAIACARMLREQVVPPTAGCEELEPDCPLDVVRGARRAVAARTALSTSSAFAGHNAAIVLRRAAAHFGAW
ncbi:MAG: beta-ketoacyl synthase [Candidatus Binatia bacterium]